MSEGKLRLPWYRRVLLMGPLVAVVTTVIVLIGSLAYFRLTYWDLRRTATRHRLELVVRQLAETIRPWDLPLLQADPPFSDHSERLTVRLDGIRPLTGVDRITLLDGQFRILASSPRGHEGVVDHLVAEVVRGDANAAGDDPAPTVRSIGARESTLTVACIPLFDPAGARLGYLSVLGSSLVEVFSRDVIDRLTATIVVVTVIMVTLLTALFLSLNRPLTRLAAEAARLAAGDRKTPIDVRGPGEIGMLGVALETTRDRVFALEAALLEDAREQRERAERMEVLSDFYLAHLPVGTAVITPEAVLHLNARGREILAIERNEDFVGTPLGLQMKEALAKGREMRGSEIAVRDESGVRRILAYSFTILPQGPGSVGGRQGFAVFSDVTASREGEEIRRLTANLAAVGDLAAGMAHEIRNPLGAIRDLIDLLDDRVESEEERREIMAQVRMEVNGINNLIESLLAASRPSPGDWQPVSLGELAGEVRQEYRIRRIEAPETIGAGKRAMVAGDPELLKRVLVNLVDNARAASAKGVKVEVEEDADAGECRWRVTDSGPGIPPEMLERVFLPFTTGKPGGTGLGLYLVHRIVAAHGGSIALRNLRPGLEVVVTLPRKEV